MLVCAGFDQIISCMIEVHSLGGKLQPVAVPVHPSTAVLFDQIVDIVHLQSAPTGDTHAQGDGPPAED